MTDKKIIRIIRVFDDTSADMIESNVLQTFLELFDANFIPDNEIIGKGGIVKWIPIKSVKVRR